MESVSQDIIVPAGSTLKYRIGMGGKTRNVEGPTIFNKDYQLMEMIKDGKYHRTDGPARVSFRDEEYISSLWDDNDDKAKYDDYDNVTGEEWYIDGKLHRLDGPAVDWENSSLEYWINGKHYLHEEYLEVVKVINAKSRTDIADAISKHF